jgi:ADP-ribosylglycohydrolase
MPNGGMDNCGNCVWNRTEGDRTRSGYCQLRNAPISIPFWTYCANFESWTQVLPKIKPAVQGPIYASGLFEGSYMRIPWYGNNEPQPNTSGVCSVTGVRFGKGIRLRVRETGEVFHFATNNIYCNWVDERLNSGGTNRRPVIRQSSGDKELHGAYAEIFHQGHLCCDYMHLGKDKVFESALAFTEGDDAFNGLNDKIRGAILCGAIGDAMGRQVESLTPGSYPPVIWYKPWRGWKSGPIGTITDDTQMTWWLSESLLFNGRLDPDDLAQRFTKHHIRGIGKATREFVTNYKDRHMPWYESGVGSSGNGAAMRAAPVGIFFRNDFDEMKLAAGLQAMVTHNDRMAIASSIVVAYATAKLLRMNPSQIVDLGQMILFCRDLADSIEGIENDGGYTTRMGGKPTTLVNRIREEIPRFLDARVSPAEVQKEFWSGAYVLESLPFALYCFLYSPGHFDRVLYNSVNESKDSDTVAAMACTLCGALNGLEQNMNRQYWTKPKGYCEQDLLAITPMESELDYLESLEFKEDLIALADRLTTHAWGG